MGALCYNRQVDKQLSDQFLQQKQAQASIQNNNGDKKIDEENATIIINEDQNNNDINHHQQHEKSLQHKQQHSNEEVTQGNDENSNNKFQRSNVKRRTVIDRLYVCYALYHLTEVTQFMTQFISHYDLKLQVKAELFGLQSSSKKKKLLNVWIWENTGLTHYQALEGEILNIHRDEYNIIPLQDLSEGIKILSAVFGTLDVSQKVQEQVNKGVLKFQATSQLFEGSNSKGNNDQTIKKQKRILVVLAQVQGHKNIIFKQCEEGAEIQF